MERIQQVRNALVQSTPNPKDTMSFYASKSKINEKDLQDIFYGPHYYIRQQVFDVMKKYPDLFKQPAAGEKTRIEARQIVWRQLRKLIEEFNLNADLLNEKNFHGQFYYALGQYDMDLSTRESVIVYLFGITVRALGTEKHQIWADKVMAFQEVGCFALTELTHGSNAKNVRTRADFDPKTREFVINTPEETDMKFWIGAAAHSATLACVWAQLYIGEKNYGPCAFVVRIRDQKTHDVVPGVTVGDCGPKVGLIGVDNGYLIFNNVRVPYDALLDKLGGINNEGTFVSPFKSIDKRFGASFSSLTGGRIGVVTIANGNLLNAVTIASRFAVVRRQFGLPGQPETPIIEYPIIQNRLFHYLINCFAIGSTAQDMIEAFQFDSTQKKSKSDNEIHALSSALKAYSSWNAARGITECREICGGLGYSSYNRFGSLRDNNDINTTWEGDSNILLQQTTKFLLDTFKKIKTGKNVKYYSTQFLTPEIEQELFPQVSPLKASNYNIQKALEFRANFLVHELGKTFMKEIQEANNPLDAFNGLQVLGAKEASIAFVELYIFTEFGKRITLSKSDDNKEILNIMVEAYGLKILETDTLLREVGYLNRDDTAYIQSRLKQINLTLKDQLVGIINAIAVPDHILNAPIGAKDGDIYKKFLGLVRNAPHAEDKPSYWQEMKL